MKQSITLIKQQQTYKAYEYNYSDIFLAFIAIWIIALGTTATKEKKEAS